MIHTFESVLQRFGDGEITYEEALNALFIYEKELLDRIK
jgi:hypothetical protein